MIEPVGILQRRRSGILLHPSSLPGPGPCGDLGADAYRFVDFLASSGQTVWQVLPLGPTNADRSPYQSLSVHAGDPLLISVQRVIDEGLISAEDVNPLVKAGDPPAANRDAVLAKLYAGFKASAGAERWDKFNAFVDKQAFWLEDFALYQAIKRDQAGAPWVEWPAPLRRRHRQALAKARTRLGAVLDQVRFEQYLFFEQWHALKAYANGKGILLFGDMPIFVDHDSADVWANRDYFELDNEGRPTVVAGVPPDYFSQTGQRWGNPHYRWKAMALDGYKWWIERLRTLFELCDLVRIDHFRGFHACWVIPAENQTALEGHWQRAPGEEVLTVLSNHFGTLPLVAEDLGVITTEVEALRDKFALPGMKILQFAFDGDSTNPYLPHNHKEHCVVYTGTHDNNTTLGWYRDSRPQLRARINDYLGCSAEDMPWALVRAALASVATMAIVPLQDVLALGEEARMNVPGTTSGNWRWRFSWPQVESEISERLGHLSALYGRHP